MVTTEERSKLLLIIHKYNANRKKYRKNKFNKIEMGPKLKNTNKQFNDK
ncbi:hypothetical protein SPHINGO8BC_60529 [Sphingobacterium multivorum]|uniref:Uncharacterized protein n=1 Tax=Sphingobacterium multivorum TaxID=28454 RepID=A0A654DHR5_SPHMU|nr:hypothetical protein SPHINGO8BC_60529 [Sphingobacterium multivorum]